MLIIGRLYLIKFLSGKFKVRYFKICAAGINAKPYLWLPGGVFASRLWVQS